MSGSEMRLLLALMLAFACNAAHVAHAAAGGFTVLCYHEVRGDVREYPDAFAVDTAALVRQFEWLRGNGYVPVSLEAIVAARGGGKPLPDKAVLLSFDDAYLSFYTLVYPLLREFGFPALLGVVGKWIDDPRTGEPMLYGEGGTVTDASFPSWNQLREMAASGLVEIASHTYDLHHGVAANPQGNLQPAATARAYDAATGRYENDASWRARVRADLARNSSAIERGTGQRPRAVVWPYGSYNGELVRMARELDMPFALTLEDGANTPEVPLTAIRRVLVEHNPALAEFAIEARGPLRPEPVRVVQLSLDAVYSADAAQQERNLSALLERMQVLKPTHVWLQAISDLDGAAYFPTRHLPMRADLFNRVAWQLASRVDVKVFAVLPVTGWRLQPTQVVETYEDLARFSNFDGLLFADGDLEFTRRLAAAARSWRALKVARTGADPDSDFLVAAMPPRAEMISTSPRTIYMLDKDRPAKQMRELQLGGALNFGYRGDDAARDDPPLARIAPAMSLRVNPASPGLKGP